MLVGVWFWCGFFMLAADAGLVLLWVLWVRSFELVTFVFGVFCRVDII